MMTCEKLLLVEDKLQEVYRDMFGGDNPRHAIRSAKYERAEVELGDMPPAATLRLKNALVMALNKEGIVWDAWIVDGPPRLLCVAEIALDGE